MYAVIKVEITTDEKTSLIVDGQSKICNWLYNHLLETANSLKKQFWETKDLTLAKILYSERGLRNLLPDLKKEYVFLKSVHSSLLKNSALRLSSAIRKHKQEKKRGWPKFRSWKKSWFSLLYDEPDKGWKVINDTLVLSLVGVGKLSFHIKDHEILCGKILRNLRIVKQNGSYYAIFTVEKKVAEKKEIRKVIAFDPNHKNLCYGVDGDGNSIEIMPPYFLKKYDIRIDEIKSKRDHCKKRSQKMYDEKSKKEYFLPSKKWKKYNCVLERLLHKRREQTKTFMFTLSNLLCCTYDFIGMGDYVPHGGGITTKMRRAMNNRSLIGRFKDILAWTAEKSGKFYVEYDEKDTTRVCSNCGYKIESGLLPSIRNWHCPNCSADHHRDENAAKNGLQKLLREFLTKGEKQFSLVPCSGLDFVKSRWAWRVFPSGVEKHLRGKNDI